DGRAGGQVARDGVRVELCAQHAQHLPGRLGRDGLAAMDHGEQAGHLVGRRHTEPPAGGGVGRDAAGAVEDLAVERGPRQPEGVHPRGDGPDADLVDEQVGGRVVAERDHEERRVPDGDLERRGEVLEDAGARALVDVEHDDGVFEAEAPVFHLVENFHENGYLDDAGRGERLVTADAERVAGRQVDDREADHALVAGDPFLEGGPKRPERLLGRGRVRHSEGEEGQGHCEHASRAAPGASTGCGRRAAHRNGILSLGRTGGILKVPRRGRKPRAGASAGRDRWSTYRRTSGWRMWRRRWVRRTSWRRTRRRRDTIATTIACACSSSRRAPRRTWWTRSR